MSYRVPPLPGGLERHVDCLTREQVARGHRVAVMFRHGTAVPPGAQRLPLARTALSRASSLASARLGFAAAAARAVRALPRPDLLHQHGDHLEVAALGPTCRRLGIPLVLTVHGGLSTTWPHPRLARAAFRLVDAFVALGATPAADLRERGVEPARIHTMSSGLDLSALARIEPIDREPGLLVSVGALDPVKHHDLLIAAFHELRRSRPGLRLVVVGDGPERSRLTQLAAGAPVEFVGRLARDQVYRLVGRAELFVLASRRLAGKAEGVPTAALEALALGTPVVVSSDASLDPVVTDGAAYRTFRSGSVSELVEVVRTLLDDRPGRWRMAALGAQAAQSLGWPMVAERIDEVYRTVLPRRHALT
ncbi:glycosyltransferase family 4 protein [Micromonospora sp. NPDC003776]